uniref:Cytochrome b5 heme-binding domain-containing protein n=10 Tax=Gossypium TaxID=3633 RepID=A0A0D2UK50_GOSRA|nr:hypothetical protein B456_010G244800 [Gossypium raimondii]
MTLTQKKKIKRKERNVPQLSLFITKSKPKLVVVELKTLFCSPPFLLVSGFSSIYLSMDLTPQQLIQFNGSDPSKPIYVAINGRIYDVTAGKSFYGPGGAYAMFAGKDASRALAKMSKNEEDVCPNLDGLSEKEMDVLNDWVKKFEAKYPVVGRVVS